MAGKKWYESVIPESRAPKITIDTNVPHPARIYDYWLGGKDNFAADRRAAEAALTLMPELRYYAVSNRRFLVRAVRFLASSGITQFLDLGTGLPTAPNVHEVAQDVRPDARVVYVDNDPIVQAHAEALLGSAGTTAVVRADFRDAERVLAEAWKLLDFALPVAIMFVASLHHVENADDPASIVAAYLRAVAPGSYLVLSHGTDDVHTERMRTGSERARNAGVTYVPRGYAEILGLFNGRELIEPGLVQVSQWRPEGPLDPRADRALAYAGIAQC